MSSHKEGAAVSHQIVSHTSGPGQATTTHAAIGLSLKAVSGEGRHTLDHTAFLAARARRLFATGFLDSRAEFYSKFTTEKTQNIPPEQARNIAYM